jgi:hypothetical protein
MSPNKKIWLIGMILTAVCLIAGAPAFATTTVGFTVTNVGSGVYEYNWTVNYGGQGGTDGKFGHMEIYLPFAYMNLNSNANGGSKKGTFTGGDGTTVTLPYNAGHYGATGWAQSAIQLESPDQEGGEFAKAEIDFNTTSADSNTYVYHFSYRVDSLITSFYYELATASESEGGAVWKEGSISVPLSPSALFLATGLLGLGGWRRFREG